MLYKCRNQFRRCLIVFHLKVNDTVIINKESVGCDPVSLELHCHIVNGNDSDPIIIVDAVAKSFYECSFNAIPSELLKILSGVYFFEFGFFRRVNLGIFTYLGSVLLLPNKITGT